MLSVMFTPGASATEANLFELTLEELLDLQVTTASKRNQAVTDVPAPITVITAEDIRRSQAKDLSELLRRVPGLYVGRLHGGLKATSSRTAAERFANKLLVMVDGRSIYSPSFSGVMWEQQDIMLENVERVEVIRGPGGALWGANAVNGIINIITKNAADTQGGMVSGSISQNRYRGAMRYGFAADENTHVRIYGHGNNEDAGFAEMEAHDDWRQGRLGLRLDNITGNDRWQLQAEANKAIVGHQIGIPDGSAAPPSFQRTVIDDDRYTGGHILGRWERNNDDGDQVSLQLYWDYTRFDASTTEYRQHTFDVEFQQLLKLSDRQKLIWGLGYRGIDDEFSAGDVVRADPEERYTSLYSAFVQHEVDIVRDRLTLTSGLKSEYNDYTHDEWQPSLRLSYTPKERATVWLGWSRAARTPSRVNNDVIFRNRAIPPATFVEVFGSENFESEYVDAFEAGTRLLLNEEVSFDLAVYYHDYDNLRTFEQTAPVNFVAGNEMHGAAYGAELMFTWRPTPKQSYYLAYAYTGSNFDLLSGSLDGSSADGEDERFPHNQVFIAADWQVTPTLDAGINVTYVDNLESGEIGARVDLDVRLIWRPVDDLEVALVGRNLTDPSHAEYGSQRLFRSETTEVRRSVTLTVTKRF
jgi:iron complex outermembrane receptor protein